jgi:hypothetical protein
MLISHQIGHRSRCLKNPFSASTFERIEMLTIKGPSDKPCFICGSREKTADVQFADRTFRGVLCLNHIHEKIKPEVKGADSQASRRTA